MKRSSSPWRAFTDPVINLIFRRTIVRSSLRAAEDRAMARAEMVANLPAVGDLFAKRDRERLPAECGPMLEIQPATA